MDLSVQNPPPTGERFVSYNELMDRLTVCRTTVWNMVQAGELPKPVSITRNRVGWPSSVINAWMASKTGKTA